MITTSPPAERRQHHGVDVLGLVGGVEQRLGAVATARRSRGRARSGGSSAPTAVSPGSKVSTHGVALRRAASSREQPDWVDLPAPSPPSKHDEDPGRRCSRPGGWSRGRPYGRRTDRLRSSTSGRRASDRRAGPTLSACSYRSVAARSPAQRAAAHRRDRWRHTSLPRRARCRPRSQAVASAYALGDVAPTRRPAGGHEASSPSR